MHHWKSKSLQLCIRGITQESGDDAALQGVFGDPLVRLHIHRMPLLDHNHYCEDYNCYIVYYLSPLLGSLLYRIAMESTGMDQ